MYGKNKKMKEIHLNMQDNGSIIDADILTTIFISLSGNATTGYGWALEKVDRAVAGNIQSQYKKSSGNAAGAGGDFIFTLSELKKGNTGISFKYWKHWEGDASIIKRFEITINVN